MRVPRFLCAAGTALVLAGCASSGGSTEAVSGAGLVTKPEFTPELIAEGRLLYSRRPCQQCHGANGSGTVNAPALNDNNWLHGNGTYDNIVQVIVNGVSLSNVVAGYSRGMPPRGMPINEADAMRMGADAVRLTDDQVKAVAVYVCSLSACKDK
jgi:mono/diheme cytochrome c family protein